MVVHGLTGGSDTNYIKDAAVAGQKEGFRVVCMNYRGINSEMKVITYFLNSTNNYIYIYLEF